MVRHNRIKPFDGGVAVAQASTVLVHLDLQVDQVVVVDLVNLHLVVELVEPMVMLAVMELDQDPRSVEAVVALQRQEILPLKDMVEMDHQMFIDMDQLIQ